MLPTPHFPGMYNTAALLQELITPEPSGAMLVNILDVSYTRVFLGMPIS